MACSQDVLLFSGSIYENIVFGNPNASKAEVSAAKKAGMEFISSFPDGLGTGGDRVFNCLVVKSSALQLQGQY